MNLDLHKKGNDAFSRGQFREALTHYAEALLNDPNNATIYSNRAQCYIRLEEWANAFAESKKGLQLEMPELLRIKLLYRKATSAHKLQRTDEARNALDELFVIDPSNRSAHDLRATIPSKKAKLANARSEDGFISIKVEHVEELPAEFADILKPRQVEVPIVKQESRPSLAAEKAAQELFGH